MMTRALFICVLCAVFLVGFVAGNMNAAPSDADRAAAQLCTEMFK